MADPAWPSLGCHGNFANAATTAATLLSTLGCRVHAAALRTCSLGKAQQATRVDSAHFQVRSPHPRRQPADLGALSLHQDKQTVLRYHMTALEATGSRELGAGRWATSLNTMVAQGLLSVSGETK